MRRVGLILAVWFVASAGTAWAQPPGGRPLSAHSSRARRAAAFLFGDNRVESRSARSGVDAARFTAPRSGRASSITVYLRRGTAARALLAGVYADQRGRPGRLLASGQATLTHKTGWITVAVRRLAVTRGRSYWIVVVGRGGALGLEQSSGCTRLGVGRQTALPRAWRGVAQPARCRISAYVGGTAQGAVGSSASATGSGRGSGSGNGGGGGGSGGSGTGTGSGGGGSGSGPGSGSGGGGAPPPPASTSAPAISGTAQAGQTLSATAGSWSNAPSSYAYQWQDCTNSGCTNIAGATSSIYVAKSTDVTSTLDVHVTATNAGGSATATSAKTQTVAAAPLASTGIHVTGSSLADGTGAAVRLQGVVRSGTEYMCSEGYGIFDGQTGASEFQPMLAWGINTVFMGLNEDCWLGINTINPAYAAQNYITAIKNEVTAAEAAGIYPVIGWFWGDPGTEIPTGNDPNGGGQPALPDNDHAPLFWQEVAQTFKNDPNVIFRLQEEPHPSASGANGQGASTSGGFATNLYQWQCWAHGSVQYTPAGVSPTWGVAPTPSATTHNCDEHATNGSTLYQTVGMQSLINIIRGAGANNVIQVPGIGYANMLACSPTTSPTTCGMIDSADGVALHDTVSPAQLMADVDVYPDAGQVCASTSCYDTTYAPVAAQMPIDAGEVGPNGSTDTNTNIFLDWMDAHSQNYYAWVWDTWGSLISTYSGTPDNPWGISFKTRLTGSTPPPITQPTDGITLTPQAVGCTNPTLATIPLAHAVSAGDDLFLVVGGGGYTAAASTVNSVSDNVNGAWTRLANTGSQLGGNQEYVSYAVYELQNSRAAAAGALTITIPSTWGQSGMSSVVVDASGVASVGATAFDTAVQSQTSTFTSPAVTPASNDVVLGLYGNYSHSNDTMSAPSGWNTDTAETINTPNCAGAGVDWTQTTSTAPVAASILDTNNEYHYSGAIVLHP